MKKATIILVLMLMLVQCVGCGSGKANTDISAEEDQAAAATSGPETEIESESLTEEGAATSGPETEIESEPLTEEGAATSGSETETESEPLTEEGASEAESIPTEQEPEYVTLSYDGNSASVTVDSVFLDDDGKVSVVLKGTGYSFNGILPIRNGQLVVAFGVDALVGETRYSWHTASFENDTITYNTDATELPEQIVLYSNDNKDEEFTFEAGPFITNKAQTGEPETEDGSEITELAGQWTGVGQPVGGGEQIFLEIDLQEDGTGTYLFRQGDYSETYPVFVNDDDGEFSVDIPADNTLQITDCGGTYEYDGDVLTLHIVTEFASGRRFAYDVDCERAQ